MKYINIHFENVNTLTPKTITTQEAIVSGIESTIKSVGQTYTHILAIHKSSINKRLATSVTEL